MTALCFTIKLSLNALVVPRYGVICLKAFFVIVLCLNSRINSSVIKVAYIILTSLCVMFVPCVVLTDLQTQIVKQFINHSYTLSYTLLLWLIRYSNLQVMNRSFYS